MNSMASVSARWKLVGMAWVFDFRLRSYLKCFRRPEAKSLKLAMRFHSNEVVKPHRHCYCVSRADSAQELL
mgnify:CR=1 FL=1